VVLVWPQRNQLHLTLWRCIAQWVRNQRCIMAKHSAGNQR
jgi:hypothetical protein